VAGLCDPMRHVSSRSGTWQCCMANCYTRTRVGWLGGRVVSILDSGADAVG